MVVRIVPAKNMDCPKLQLGSLVTLPIADTPRLFASIISIIKSSNSSSGKKKKKKKKLNRSADRPEFILANKFM